MLQGNTLREDLSMQISFKKGHEHSFIIEPEKDHRSPLSFSHAQLKGVIAEARSYAERKAKEAQMWGKERTSLALRRMTSPAPPHRLAGVSGLGRSSSEVIRITSTRNLGASDTKPDETKPNPDTAEEEVGSAESKKEVIDLGHKKGGKDREKIALQMGIIAAKQHSHKLEEALKAQADQPDADGSGRKASPLYEQRSAATKELMEKELPALETLLALQGEDQPVMMLM